MTSHLEKAIEGALNDFGASEHAIVRGEQKLAQIIANRLMSAMTRHGVELSSKEVAFFIETSGEMAQRAVDFFAQGKSKSLPPLGRHNLAQLFSDDTSLLVIADKACRRMERDIEVHAMKRVAKQRGFVEMEGVKREGLPETTYIAPAAKTDPVYTGHVEIKQYTPTPTPLAIEYGHGERTKTVPFVDTSVPSKEDRYPAKKKKR